MKKLSFLLLFLLIMALLPTGCGKDGQPGAVYISINWYGTLSYYWTTDPAIPGIFYNGQDYSATAARYNFEYRLLGGSLWVGWYETEQNPGEEGGLIADGEDGKDRRHHLWCNESGPTLSVTEVLPPDGVEQEQFSVKRALESRFQGSDAYRLDPEVVVKEIVRGNTRIHVEAQRAYLK